ncbi:MAG: peptidylprolyl isomerase [Gilvibacter sp.]
MKRMFLFYGVLFLLLNCEDSKKQPATTAKESVVTKSDSTVKKAKKTIAERTYALPLLNEHNADSLLLEYGKQNPETKAVINTSFGEIHLELFNETPVHRANFVYLAKHAYYNDTFFHRVVPNFIIQAGSSDNASTNKKRAKIGKYRLSAELKSGRKHTRGTLSGAKHYRENPDKKSAAYEFFIFLGPDKSTGHLNGNYTIFGKVTKGMDVVDTIANLDSDEGEWPLSNVYISVSVIE